MKIDLSAADSITVVILLVTFYKSRKEEERQKELNQQWVHVEKMETTWAKVEAANKKMDKIAASVDPEHRPESLQEDPREKIETIKNLLTAHAFSSWIGSRSFVMSLCCALIGLCFGYTSVPGAIIGLLISSPRFMGYFVAGLGKLAGN